jgi:glycosyltransferase involved in cell wall biosynthesis
LRIAFVIQRYGLEVAGGSELHCRWLAEHLSRDHAVEVFTTTARDYVEWGDPYPEGEALVSGVVVHRFDARRRDLRRLAALQERVFGGPHTRGEEEAWYEANGPVSPGLVQALVREKDRFDRFIFYSFRYHPVFAGLPAVREKALLVPTAEEDGALSLGVAQELLRMPRALLYLTPEEKALVESRSGNRDLPSAVIGTGLEPAAGAAPDVRERFFVERPFLLYVGRIDRNKGCPVLFAFFTRFVEETGRDVDLLLGGKSVIPIPNHPRIRHLGSLTEGEKAGLMASCAVFVMPSALESLSIVLLEAWQRAAPALVNARCRVLEGQCRRSDGGLAYRGYDEFKAALLLLLDNPDLGRRLGEQGRAFVGQECGWGTVLARVGGVL